MPGHWLFCHLQWTRGEWFLLNLDRLTDDISRVEPGFLAHEAIPKPVMELNIYLHLAELYLSNTISITEVLGPHLYCTTVCTWVQKVNLQLADSVAMNHVPLDVTVIQLNDNRNRLYVAVDAELGCLLRITLIPMKNQAISSMFLAALRKKHQQADAIFLVDSGAFLIVVLHRHDLRFQYKRHGSRNIVKRVFHEEKRRTSQFSNTFSHVHPAPPDCR